MNLKTINQEIANEAVESALRMVKGAGKEAEQTKKTMGVVADAVTIAVQFISIFHQIGFLLLLMATDGLHWGHSPLEWLSPLSTLVGSLLIPATIDATMFQCIKGLSNKIASTWSKICCFAALLIPAAASAYVNYAAPGPPIQRYLFAGVVVLILICQGLRAFYRSNFGILQNQGEKAVKEIRFEEPAAEGKRCAVGCTCGKHTPRKTTRKPSQRKNSKKVDAFADTVAGSAPAGPVADPASQIDAINTTVAA